MLPELPPDNVDGVLELEELTVLPLALHDMSVSPSMKAKKIEIKKDLESCNTIPFLFNQGAEQGNNSKENNEHDSKVENQFLYTAPRLKHCSSAAAAENAPETRTTCLKQDKNDYCYTENDLYYPDCW